MWVVNTDGCGDSAIISRLQLAQWAQELAQWAQEHLDPPKGAGGVTYHTQPHAPGMSQPSI